MGNAVRAILPAQVANHSAGFGLSCLLTELAIPLFKFVLTLY